MITKADMIFIRNVVNNQLLPMMLNLGFDIEGYRFEFDESEEVSTKDSAQIVASFMPYVKFDKEYLQEKFGVVLDGEVEDDKAEDTDNIMNKLKNLYS